MKKIASIILAIVFVLSMTACGSESASNITSTISENEETTENLSNTTSALSYDKQDLDSILSALTNEFDNAAQILSDDSQSVLNKLGDSYSTYDTNKTYVTDFYRNSLSQSETLYSTSKTISIDYFKSVAAQGLDDYDAWNNAMKKFYDVWDSGMQNYYDAWDIAYKNIYDQCDSLIQTASSSLEYSEYYDAWSNMYENYSSAWSNMYESYFDAWSQTYSNYSDVCSGFYGNQTDVDSILKAAAEQKNTDANISEESHISSTSETESKIEAPTDLIDGMRPEFKEAMDSYETFFDEYVSFMEKYVSTDGNDLALLADYTNYLRKYEEMMEALEAWDSEDMNTEELAYYIEVQSRINQKLLEVSG